MDAETCRKTADNIAADLRDIDANEPEYPAEQRAFLESCERGFRRLAEEKGGYPVDAEQTSTADADTAPANGGVSAFEPENAVVAMRPSVELHEIPDGTVVSATPPPGNPQFWLNSQTGEVNEWED